MRILATITAALCALLLIGSALADGTPTSAPTATPGPANIIVVKTAGVPVATPGDLVTFTVTVYNTGQSDSFVRLVDPMPPGAWFVATVDGWRDGCGFTLGTLYCAGLIGRRHLNFEQTAFIDGRATVSIVSFANACGVITNNVAVFADTGVIRNASASIVVACPTPVPTATPIPPTATATLFPTSTLVPPTQTPVIIFVDRPTATPTITQAAVIRHAPLPPRTGTGMQPVDGVNTGLRVTIGLIATALGLGVVAYSARRR